MQNNQNIATRYNKLNVDLSLKTYPQTNPRNLLKYTLTSFALIVLAFTPTKYTYANNMNYTSNNFSISHTRKCSTYLQIDALISRPVINVEASIDDNNNDINEPQQGDMLDISPVLANKDMVRIGRNAGGCISPRAASTYLRSYILEFNGQSLLPLDMSSTNEDRTILTCEMFLTASQEGFQVLSRSDISNYYAYHQLCYSLGAATLGNQGVVPIFNHFQITNLSLIPVAVIHPVTRRESVVLMEDSSKGITLQSYADQNIIEIISNNSASDTIVFTYKGRQVQLQILTVSDFDDDSAKDYLISIRSRSNFGSFYKQSLALLSLPVYDQVQANFQTADIACGYEDQTYRCKDKVGNLLKYLD